MIHTKDPLLLVGKNNLWSSVGGVLFALSGPLPYVRRHIIEGARCSSVVRAFAHGAMGRRIDPSWGGPIELFLVPASAPRLAVICAILSVG